MARTEKIGRNDPCWCGSGKKYKKCHLNRSDDPAVPYHQLATNLLKLLPGDKRCLYPPDPSACEGSTIRAHSISRNAALTKIAREGKVYQPNANPFEIAKNKGTIMHSLVGISLATTFTGFCSPHDNALFRPIDEGTLTPTREQGVLLHYRALCRELYVKRPTVLTNESLRQLDHGKTLEQQQSWQDFVSSRALAINDSVRQMEADKATCDRMVLAHDYGEIFGCALNFRKLPTLACSGYCQPTYDFSGKMLQDIADMSKPLFSLSFTLLPNDTGGIAVFAWLPHADSVCRPLLSSLLCVPDSRKSDALVQLVFDSFENHAVQPDWWDDMSRATRLQLEERMLNWTDARPIDSRALIVGTQKFADWEFETAGWI